MEEAVEFDLAGVEDGAGGVFFEDELDAAVEGAEALPVGVGLALEMEMGIEVIDHGVAAAPGSAGFADEGFSVEEGDGVVVGEDA